MKIHEHLAVEKLSAACWGRIMGLSRSAAAKAVNGDTIPHKDVILRTYIWSRGKVRPDDWYDLPDLAAMEQAA